jgi:hypothetical protein
MGSAVAVANHELDKPTDGSDITDPNEALDEVVRLRVQLNRMTHPLPTIGTWKHVLDAKTGHVYFWDMDSGSVLWNLPGMLPLSKVTNKHFRKKEKTEPAPTPNEADFAFTHKLFKEQARRAVHCVEQQILRQKVVWEHEWHMELLDYSAELHEQLQALAKNNPLVVAAGAAEREQEKDKSGEKAINGTTNEQVWSSEKKASQLSHPHLAVGMLKSTEDRAKKAAEEGHRNSETSLEHLHMARAARHGALMKKLAGRRQRKLKQKQENQENHDKVVVKLQRALAKNTGRHGVLMKTLGEKLKKSAVLRDKMELEIHTNLEITCGWCMLFDRQGFETTMQMTPDNVYFWHPEHGSQWERPDEMEFDMQLKHVFGHTIEAQKFANDLKAVDTKENDRIDQATSIVVEKWLNRHNLKNLQRKDSQLENEVMRLEDELAKVRSEKFGQHDATNVL